MQFAWAMDISIVNLIKYAVHAKMFNMLRTEEERQRLKWRAYEMSVCCAKQSFYWHAKRNKHSTSCQFDGIYERANKYSNFNIVVQIAIQSEKAVAAMARMSW